MNEVRDSFWDHVPGDLRALFEQAQVNGIEDLRTVGAAVAKLEGAYVPSTGLVSVEHHEISSSGQSLLLTVYRPPGGANGACGLYLHPGGMVYGSVQDFDPAVRWYAEASGVMLVGVDYRLAPEHPYPAAVDDALAALRWIHAHSSELDVDPRLIGVIGESGGACVAAAAALQAHDEGLPRLRRQILIEPMLDDRTVRPDPSLAAGATWTYELNAMAWSAVAGAMDAAGTPYLAPARASTLAPGLPPAYIDVGSRDIFRNEAMTYAGRLLSAGVEVEHHLYPGMPHGFAGSAPTHPQSQLALRLRAAALMSLAQPM